MSHRIFPPLAVSYLFAGLFGTGVPPISEAQTTMELRQEAEAQARAGGSLPWAPDFRLEWRHFRGHPPSTYFTAAQTSTGVTYLIGCHGHETRFAVLATISTVESWVRPDIPGDSLASAQTLRHEQTHFDIAEIFARELRRGLSAGAASFCPGNLPAARQLFDSLSRGSDAMQALYDNETAHGTRMDAQAEWTSRVAVRLDSLTAYSADARLP